MTESNQKIETMSYEEAMVELEKIIANLEAETSSLQETLELYERGQLLAQRCSNLLENAQLRIQTLSTIRPNEGDAGSDDSP